jgi:acetoin utilization protein AcuB
MPAGGAGTGRAQGGIIMSKPIPTIQKYMTTSPHTVGREQSLTFAHNLMREFHIRHLPVLDGGKLLGILSERDITLVESLEGVDPSKVTVEDAMTQEPYSVHPDALLDEVVGDMATHKYGSAVVMQNEHVVGIFTTVDALKAFAELLHSRLSK